MITNEEKRRSISRYSNFLINYGFIEFCSMFNLSEEDVVIALIEQGYLEERCPDSITDAGILMQEGFMKEKLEEGM